MAETLGHIAMERLDRAADKVGPGASACLQVA